MLQVDLKVLEGKQQGKLIPLNVRQFLIGREQDCHLRPNSDLVSRHHCVFTIDDFTVRLRDLGSTNGTFVNGERVQGQVVLNPGDTVVVGKLVFEIVVRQPAAVAVGAGGARSGAGGAESDSSSSIFAEPEAPVDVAAQETGVHATDTVEFPAVRPDEDTAIMPTFPPPEAAAQQMAPQPGYMPSPPYGAPPYGMPPGYGMPQGYPPGYPAGYMPAPGYPPAGYPMPGYMPAPGYPAQQMQMPMMPGMMPGYGMPQQAPPENPAVDAKIPDVVLPDPESTGAVAPAPPPPPPADGSAPATEKKPSDAAADIIRSHRLRRPS
ncbi:MAG: FHA domain-containing protein [Planctomycetales bacterium]